MALACGPRHVPGRAVVYRPPLRLLTRSPSRRCNARVDCGDSQQGGVASFALAHRLRIVVRNLHVDLRGSLDEFLLIETTTGRVQRLGSSQAAFQFDKCMAGQGVLLR